MEEEIAANRFEKKVLQKRDNEWTGEGTMCKRNVLAILARHVRYASNGNGMMFRPNIVVRQGC